MGDVLGGVNNTNKMVKAMIFKSATEEAVPSNSQTAEDTNKWGSSGDVYTPPYDLHQLLRLPEYSNILNECIDAYKNNIPGFGWEIVSIIDTNTSSKDNAKTEEAQRQKEEVEFFFKTCNYKQSFVDLMKMLIDHRERCGIAYLEIMDNAKGVPASFEVVKDPSKIRILKPLEMTWKSVTYTLDSGKRVKRLPVKFHRYLLVDGSTRIYFKEYGDPRMMDKDTGEYKTTGIPVKKRATSLMVFKIPCAYSPYGVPRYIGKIPSIIGSRKSEELNIKYFENGKVVPAAIVIQNGQLTTESYDTIKGMSGVDQSFRFLLLEAEGFKEGDSIVEDDGKKNNVKIDIKPLTELIQQDGLFQTYDKNNRDKIRASYNVPPIYTGESQDYNKSTAQTARAVAEALVFQPKREEACDPLNRMLHEMGYDLVELRFKAPKITDKTELSRALEPYIKSGAATPNMLLDSLGELLGRKFDKIKDDWGDKPLQLVLKEMDVDMIVAQAIANNPQAAKLVEAVSEDQEITDDMIEQATQLPDNTNNPQSATEPQGDGTATSDDDIKKAGQYYFKSILKDVKKRLGI